MLDILSVFSFILLIGLSVYLVVSKNKTPIYDGQIVITVLENSKKVFSLELSGDPEDLEQKESVTFKVVSADIVDE